MVTIFGMSMWLTLAKVSPETLRAIQERPQLMDGMFFENDEDGQADPVPADFDPDADVLGTDYRTLTMIAEGLAEHLGSPASFEEQDTWLSKAAHGLGDLLDYDFCYGPAFVLTPAQVAEIALGLAEEEDAVQAAGGADAADPDDEADPDQEIIAQAAADLDDEDDDEDLGVFYAAAAREGKGMVGGVS